MIFPDKHITILGRLFVHGQPSFPKIFSRAAEKKADPSPLGKESANRRANRLPPATALSVPGRCARWGARQAFLPFTTMRITTRTATMPTQASGSTIQALCT